MVAQNPVTKRSQGNRIIVPGGQDVNTTYVLPTAKPGKKVQIVEVPQSRFCGFSICIASVDKADIEKLHKFRNIRNGV